MCVCVCRVGGGGGVRMIPLGNRNQAVAVI